MPTLQEVMMAGEPGAAPALDPFEAAALRQSRYVGGRYREPPPEAPTPSPLAVATSAADPLGIPSAAVGLVSPEAKEAWRNSYESDSGRHIGMFAPVPMMGSVGKMVAPVVDVAKQFPKSVGAVLGLTSATEAAEGSKQIFERASEYNEQVKNLQDTIAQQERDLKALGAQKTPEPGQYRSQRAQKAAEDRASKAGDRITRQMESITSQIEGNRTRLKEVQGIQDTINNEGRTKEAAEQPMVDRMPWTRNLPVVGGAIAAAAAYNPRLRAVMAQRQFARDMNDIVPMAEAGAGRTVMTKAGLPSSKPFQPTGGDIVAVEQAREMARRAPDFRGAGEGDLTKGLSAAPAGGIAAVEGALLPYQMDWATAGKETPAYKAAIDRLSTQEGWGKTALSSLVGATGSMVGAKIPTHRAPATTLEADLARATGAVNAFDMRQAATAAPTRAAAAVTPRPQIPPAPAPAAFSKEAAQLRGGSIDSMSEKELRIRLKKAMMGQ